MSTKKSESATLWYKENSLFDHEKAANTFNQIAEKYANRLLDDNKPLSAEAASKLFKLVKEAYKESMEYTFPDHLRMFLNMFSDRIPRSKLWEAYQSYCTGYGIVPLGRNEFYKQVEEDYNFKQIKDRDGTRILEPPKRKAIAVQEREAMLTIDMD